MNKIPDPRPPRQTRTYIKTAVLFGVAALWCLSCLAKAQSADERLRAIYTDEWKWRLEQFPGLEGVAKPVPDRLPKVDFATQEMRLKHWEDVLHKLDDVPRAQLSPEERINYDVYRPEIENFVADQKFRDHEMPANSDSAFWTDLGYTARRPFKTLTDYENWIAQMRDVPRYFREQIANMRAGLARGFTPPRLTLQGREKSIATIADGKPEDNLLYTPFREPMVGVQPSDQDKLKSEAAKVIREIVQPAYADLLKFFRDEYVPHTRTTLAAEALPEGKTYYRQKIREFTTLDLSPDEIHQIGLSEVAKLHQQMVDAMHESGFKREFPAFVQFLRDDSQFYAKTPQELLNRAAWIAKVFDGKSSQYFGYLPRMRFAIKPVPPDLAPFYTSGRGGPGVYLLNTYDLPHRPLYNLPALTLHRLARVPELLGAERGEQLRRVDVRVVRAVAVDLLRGDPGVLARVGDRLHHQAQVPLGRVLAPLAPRGVPDPRHCRASAQPRPLVHGAHVCTRYRTWARRAGEDARHLSDLSLPVRVASPPC